METLKHGVAYAKAVNANRRSVEAVVSTDTIDRVGDIIDQGSWKLDRYLQNPVVLWMHDHRSPIGRADDVAVRGGKLEATIVFSGTPKGEEIFQLFADKSLRAFSVGFRVGRIEEQRTPDGRTVTRLLDCELFEISAVTVPANPDALAKAKSLGLVPPSHEIDASKAIADEAMRAAHGASAGEVDPFAYLGKAGEDAISDALDDGVDAMLRRAGL